MIRYVVTTSTSSSGAILAKVGQWGNLPFETPEAARSYARADAKGAVHVITQSSTNRPLRG